MGLLSEVKDILGLLSEVGDIGTIVRIQVIGTIVRAGGYCVVFRSLEFLLSKYR